MLALGGMGRSGFGRMGLTGSMSFNPLTAFGSDLLAWWDADSSYWGANGSITIATGVSSWKDNVAGYNAAQATGSSQPTFFATSFASGPGVSFDGTDDALACTDAALLAALPGAANPAEFFAVAQNDAVSTVRFAASYGAGNTSGRSMGTNGAADVRGIVGDNTATAINISSGSSWAAGTRRAIRLSVGATQSIMYADGVAGAPISLVPGTTASRLRIGAGSAGSAGNFWQGTVQAVLVVKATASADKFNALQNWLNNRKG